MNDTLPQTLRETLSEKLAESLTAPLPQVTSRRLYGATRVKGKATAIVGMRFATLEAICDALDCQPGDLLRFEREAPEDAEVSADAGEGVHS